MIRYLTYCFIIAILSWPAGFLCSQVTAEKTGMKLFDDWKPDKSGMTDVSEILQAAVDWSIFNSKTLYISPGIYKVSKSILGKVTPGMNCGTHNGNKVLTITGDAVNRPVIKLIDNAAGFQNTDITKSLAVLEIRQESRNAESCLFWSGIRNLDFDLGDNPGAAGVKFNSAQDCHLINVRVYGKNYAAGFTGVPGRNATTTNCEVRGGRYGFYIPNSVGANLFGVKCTGQSVAGLYLSITRAASFAGVEITDCKGTPVICRGNNGQQGNLVLIDSKIEVSDPESFAFDVSDRALVLRNVYIKGSGKIVKGRNLNWNMDTDGWIYIRTFAHTPDSINGYQAFNVTDGKKTNDQLKDFELIDEPPEDIASKHSPDTIYAFSMHGTVSVTDFGAEPDDGLDDYPAIQEALNKNNLVFLPAGRYHISEPVTLRDRNVIFGEPGKRSQLIPLYKPDSNSWMITTPDTDGYVVIQDIAFDTPDKPYYGAVRWQTSSGFMLNVRNYLASTRSEYNSHNWEFRGKAGGSFYGLADHGQIRNGLKTGPDFRKVYVEGTFNPITFYGLNLERGGRLGFTPQNPYFGAVNCSNIRIFGAKTETDGIVFSFSNCDNAAVYAILTHCHERNEPVDPVIVELRRGTRNIELGILFCPYPGGGPMVRDESGDPVKRTNFLGLYRTGTFDAGKFDKYRAKGK